MALIRATAVLTKISGEERDAARNVWHFVTGANPPADYITKLGDALEGFYDAVAGRLGQSVQRNGASSAPSRIEMATVTFGGAGPADDTVSELFATRTMDMQAGGAPGVALPAEVAIALSFRGDVEGVPEELGVTRPKSRRRGRVFIGPLNNSVLAQDSNGNAFPQVLARQDILNAYQALVTAIGTAPGPNLQHVVYSPTSGLFFPVTIAHVDNAFDTIRSRGEAGSGRVETAVTQPPI